METLYELQASWPDANALGYDTWPLRITDGGRLVLLHEITYIAGLTERVHAALGEWLLGELPEGIDGVHVVAVDWICVDSLAAARREQL